MPGIVFGLENIQMNKMACTAKDPQSSGVGTRRVIVNHHN